MADIDSYPTSIKGVCIRLTRVDACCVPLPEGTPNSRLTTDAFVMAEFQHEYSSSSEIEIKTADSKIMAFEPAENVPRGATGKLKLGGVPIHALEMMTNGTLLVDTTAAATGTRGYVAPRRGTRPNSLQVEIWSRTPTGDCENADFPFFHWTIPCAGKWKQTSAISWKEDGSAEFELDFYAVGASQYEPSIAAELPDPSWVNTVRNGGPIAHWSTATLPAIPLGAGYD